MIVGEAEFAGGDREEPSCRGRQSMTLPRNPRHYQQTPQPPPPLLQQDQLHSMRRSSFNRSVAPVSMQMQSAAELPPPLLPPHIASCSSPDVPPPVTTSTVAVAVPNNNGSCLDSGLGGSDSSSFTFAEMHQVRVNMVFETIFEPQLKRDFVAR